jgi:type IV pilus assembly protein PilN
MIKINLLAEGRRPVIARKAKQSFLQLNEGNAANFAFVALSAVGIVAAAVWFWVLASRIESKQEEIRVAQREVDELKQVIAEVQQYEEKLKELNRKVDVITTLKDNQRGPVVILDEVSRALPDLLWLTEMDVTATSINIRGTAFNTSAVANFIDNLDRVEAFREPVLQDATRASSRGRGRATETYNYRLTVGYSMKRTPPAGEAGGAAGETGGGGGAIAAAQSARAANEQGLE